MTSFAKAAVPAHAPAGTSIELFTGGGGLALAMQQSGFNHLLAVEIDRRACDTLRANVADDWNTSALPIATHDDPWPLIEGDVREIDFQPWTGQVDVVAGGVPCQPWSLGGAHRGMDDARNLWPELLRVVREVRPRVVIAENVKGLLRPSFRPYYDYILRELAAPFELCKANESWIEHDARLTQVLGHASLDASDRYDVTFQLVNAADYGVPQQRWRVFVVAIRKDIDREPWAFPSPTHSEAALLRSQAEGDYWTEHGLEPRASEAPILSGDSTLRRWRTTRDAIRGLGAPIGDYQEHPNWLDHIGWPGARIYAGHTPNDLDRPAKTVKAGVHGVPGGESVLRLDDGSIRYLTVREVSRIMTFPDDWRLAGPRGEQMRQLGNAVPVALGKVVSDSIAEYLGQAR